jgi:hypothetical protein
MKKALVIILVVNYFSFLGQAPAKFYTRFGGTGIDIGYSVRPTLDNQFVVAGSTTSYGAGYSDVYLVKVDSMGVPIWGKTYGGFGNDVGKSVIQLIDSGYVIAGFTNSFGGGGYDAYLIRVDKNGNLIWQKAYGGLDWEFGYDLVQSADGGLIMCGSTNSFGKGKKDAFIVKYGLTGNFIWEKFFGGTEDDEFKALYSTAGTTFFAAGTTNSYGEINGDMFCFKVDNNGDSLMRIIHGGPLYDGANDVLEDNANNIILAGGSNSFSNGKMDAFFAKYSASGTFSTQTNHGLAGEDEEAFKIIKTTSPVLADYVAIYSTREIPAYKSDIKSIYMNPGLLYFGGQGSGSFGFNGEDEAFDMCAYKDKGYVQVGYTTSLGAADKDVFFIKRDSALFLGPSIVGLSKNSKQENIVSIFPNPVTGDNDVVVKIQSSEYRVKVFNCAGGEIFCDLIKENNNLDYSVPFHTWEKGIYILVIEVGGIKQPYKIIKQ